MTIATRLAELERRAAMVETDRPAKPPITFEAVHRELLTVMTPAEVAALDTKLLEMQPWLKN